MSNQKKKLLATGDIIFFNASFPQMNYVDYFS